MGLDHEHGRRWYEIRNAAESDTGPAELLIYDEIDSWFGVAPEQLVKDLARVDAEREVVVRINSPGGYIYDGITILNALRGRQGKVTVVVDGLAASAASFIAMAGDEVVMNRNAEMMIHNGHGLVVGGFEDMRKMADNLERLNRNIASIYAEKAGGTVEDWLAVMAAETWYTADEAVEAGLADRVEESPQRDAAAAAKTKARAKALAVFHYPGRQAAPAPRIAARAQTPQPVEAEATQRKEPIVASLNESALQKLGLDAEADEAAVEAAIDALTSEPTPPVEPTIDEAAKVAAKFGMSMVNTAKYDQMAAAVAQLESDRAERIKAEDEAAIKNALGTGRISAASADTWRGELAKNREGTLALLNTLPANSAVPVFETGHGVSREDQPEDVEKAGVFAQITGHAYGKDA